MITRHRDTGKPKGVFVEFASQVGACMGGLPACLLLGAQRQRAGSGLAASRGAACAEACVGLLPTLSIFACCPQTPHTAQDHLAKALTADGEPMLRRPIRIQARTHCLRGQLHVNAVVAAHAWLAQLWGCSAV